MLLQSTWNTLVSSFRMLSLILTIYNGTIMVICALVKCKPFHYHREISKAFFTIQLPFKNWSVNSKPAKYRLSKSFVPSRGSNFEKVDIIFAKLRNSNGSRRGRQFAFAKLFKKRKKKGSRPYLTYYFMWKKHQNHYNKRHHCKMSYVLADCGKQTDFKDIF